MHFLDKETPEKRTQRAKGNGSPDDFACSIRTDSGFFLEGAVLAAYLCGEMPLRPRSDFVEPCFPSPAGRPPVGPNWIHEIKHDGFRLMARRDPAGSRLFTRNGNDWTERYPLIFEAVNRLKVRSCLIDGEAVCCDDDGMPTFQKLRLRRDDRHVYLCAFDLLELDGKDLRREPLEVRKATLASLLRGRHSGLQYTSTSRIRATLSLRTPAKWAWRASYRSGWARAIAQGGRPIG